MTSELKPCASDVVQITKHDRPITMKDIEEFDGGCMNTRAVPDVPELVRYDKGDICLAIENGYDPLPSKDGEYVTYSQAADLKAENERLREALTKIASFSQTAGLLWWQAEARAALNVEASNDKA